MLPTEIEAIAKEMTTSGRVNASDDLTKAPAFALRNRLKEFSVKFICLC